MNLDENIRPYLSQEYTEDYTDFAGDLSPSEIRKEIIDVVNDFYKEFQRICYAWTMKDSFFQKFEHCKYMSICTVSKNLEQLALTIQHNDFEAFQDIQHFFEWMFDVQDSHIKFARYLYSFNKMSTFIGENEELMLKHLKIPLLKYDDRLLVPNLFSNLFNLTYPYLKCHNEIRNYDENLSQKYSFYLEDPDKELDKFEDLINELQRRVEKFSMKLTILLSMNSKRMKVLNSFFVMFVYLNFSNCLIMLIFYLCPVIPFSLVCMFQLFCLMISKIVFGFDLEKKWKPWTIQVIKKANNSEQDQAEEQDQEQQRKIRSVLQALKNKKLKNTKTSYGPLKALIILSFSAFYIWDSL